MDPAAQLRDEAARDLTAEAVRRFGQVRLRVTGNSMIPCIWPGDILTVQSRPFAQLEPGKVVLCYSNRRYWAHRLVSRVDEKVITRGDTHRFNDTAIAADHVLGEVVSIERRGRVTQVVRTMRHRLLAFMVSRSENFARILLRIQRVMPGLGATE